MEKVSYEVLGFLTLVYFSVTSSIVDDYDTLDAGILLMLFLILLKGTNNNIKITNISEDKD